LDFSNFKEGYILTTPSPPLGTPLDVRKKFSYVGVTKWHGELILFGIPFSYANDWSGDCLGCKVAKPAGFWNMKQQLEMLNC
jgi:hypothetical protein